MSFNRYYNDEMKFLEEMGPEFSRTNPLLARYLSAAGTDPDVERLLQGFAFLTGQIRQKLDDEFPEITESLLSTLWPHYLRPVPSATILRFIPRPDLAGPVCIPGVKTEIGSTSEKGQRYRFRTCQDVDLYPFAVEDVSLGSDRNGQSQLRIRFAGFPGANIMRDPIGSLPIYLHGKPAHELYFWLCHNTVYTTIQGLAENDSLPPVPLRNPLPGGFHASQALLPYPSNSFDGYRVLQEYLAFPEKFLFVEFQGLPPLIQKDKRGLTGFEIICKFRKRTPPGWKVSPDNFLPFCTPAVNLFRSDSRKIQITHERVEYPLVPEESEADVYSVEGVSAWVSGTMADRPYKSLYSFDRGTGAGADGPSFYKIGYRHSITGGQSKPYVSFVQGHQSQLVPEKQVAVFSLVCLNSHVAEMLGVGDIAEPTDTSPVGATFRNISRVSLSRPAPHSREIDWQLISHLTVNSLSLVNTDALRSILELYNLHFRSDASTGDANERHIQAIETVTGSGEDMVLTNVLDPLKKRLRHYGATVRGTAIKITIDASQFEGVGELFLFGNVLNEFFSLYATLNSFTQLTITDKRGEVYEWAPRIGHQIVI